MARAAVIPQSPTKRAGRTSTKSTAAADAKKKAPRKATPAPRTVTPALDADSDDELGFVTSKPAKISARPVSRPATKPKVTTTARARKAPSAPLADESKSQKNDRKHELEQQTEAPKKRVGRPRKTPPPATATVPKTEAAPKPRGRPRVATTAKAPVGRETAATSRRTRKAADVTNETKPTTIRIATNSTTMRSNLLRGPAKKKTVTFQDPSDSEAEQSEPEVPAAGRRRVAPKAAGAGNAGLRATAVRKSATTGTRGRKPATAKKTATQPLSPKKAKQVAKSLSSYASSDGEDDELNITKDDINDTVKLTVHSPVRHGLENTGLSSPVRRINFTPKKASSFVDENGEPKISTPKHGSEGTGLSSPVRKINFTPNRSQNAMANSGHLALPPGNTIDFSESLFMCSPARRAPQSSPFRFSLRETPNRGGSLFRDSVNPIAAPDFTPGHNSPLKMSPKKGLLGASFSQSAFKPDAPTVLARTPLFQSPAKRIASPFKSSIFSTHVSLEQPETTDNEGTPSNAVDPEQSTTPKSSPRDSEADELALEKDMEMVEDVARNIFGIELSSDSKTSTTSPAPEYQTATEEVKTSDSDGNTDSLYAEAELEPDLEEDSEIDDNANDNLQDKEEEIETICFDVMEEVNLPTQDIDDQKTLSSEAGEALEEEDQFEYEEADTICFDAMEEAQMQMEDIHDQEVQEASGSEDGDAFQDEDRFEYEEIDTICFDTMEDAHMATHEQEVEEASGSEEDESLQNEDQLEYEEIDTICFDTMEDAHMAIHEQEVEEASGLEDDESLQNEDQFEYEEIDTICFDAMEDAHHAEHELHEQELQVAEPAMEGSNHTDKELAVLETEIEEEELQNTNTGFQPEEPNPEYLEQNDMQESDTEDQPRDLPSPSDSEFRFSYLDHAPPAAILGDSMENGKEEHEEALCQSDREDEIMSDEHEVEDPEPTPTEPEFSIVSSQLPSPHEGNHVEKATSPLQVNQETPSPLSSPTVGGSASLSLRSPDHTENEHGPTIDTKNANSATIDIPLHEGNSRSPSTGVDSSALMAPSLFNTPSISSAHQSPAETKLGFTPLAQKFSRWEQNTPSQARSLRPRRRGVFSLVGPLDRTNTETPTTSGGVSYPDLSKSPLLHTPSLLAEPPLQPEGDDACLSPEHEQTLQRSSLYEDHQIINSAAKATDIFEDPDSGSNELDHSFATEFPQEHEPESHPTDDKENCGPSAIAPSTPMKPRVQSDGLRTIHTVSKVPLKAEGEESPLKLPRKRGLSLLSTSPTRSSPRVRKPTLMALNDSVPILSPSRKSPRASRSPTPKRRSVAARRSSGIAPVIAAPGGAVATASPIKKVRRSLTTEQKALHGAVVHVDVHTTEGEDASGIFVELLQQMGARCVRSWAWNPRSSLSPADAPEPKDMRVGITHVVYKDGGLRTLEKVKKAAGLVKCVGVGWVLDCERENQWLDETPYAVDSSIIPRGGAKRRKSMEPRALSNVNGTLVRISQSPAPCPGGRRSGVNPGAVETFRKITPPTHQPMPSTPPQQASADSYQFPATPGYNFANLDAIGMSPATPGFLGNHSKLIQQSCPPKQTNRGLFPGAKPTSRLSNEGEDEESRRKRRFRMEAARRKSLVYKPAVRSSLVP
ncbi:hypothetical protein N7457_008986 [Penicillium paradoxum]|uniref:uncharacterized protein n=1 Tax=Penicillium paradoxum TaxID=176176 RepID=UPI00254668EF|nr:uncharacterized protein N7457_008986 [Penicillium paradoxum]KAJ5774090.1 hypothetical protein N7457_008986 [Penicillium paradoxum]